MSRRRTPVAVPADPPAPLLPWHTLPRAWSETITAWHADLTETRATATADGYARHVSWLAADAATSYADPWQVRPTYLARWLAAQPWSVDTRRKVLISLRTFYGWGITQGWCARSPLAGVAAPPPRTRGPERLPVTPLWIEPVAGYLTHLEAGGRRAGTIDQRRWWLTRLSETYADPWTVTTDDLALWLARADYAPETKRLGPSSVRGFYQWAERAGHVTSSPARDLPAVRRPRALPRPAPDDAVSVALAAADDRTRLALLLALYAGLRRSELASLHTRDVADDHLHVTGKGGAERLIPLHPELRQALRAELLRRRVGTDLGTGWGSTIPSPDGWLFPGSPAERPITAHHLAKRIAAALPPGWTTHALRHRFASQAYAAGGRDLRAVQELLGHAKPETTARYAAVPDGARTAAVAAVTLPT